MMATCARTSRRSFLGPTLEVLVLHISFVHNVHCTVYEKMPDPDVFVETCELMSYFVSCSPDVQTHIEAILGQSFTHTTSKIYVQQMKSSDESCSAFMNSNFGNKHCFFEFPKAALPLAYNITSELGKVHGTQRLLALCYLDAKVPGLHTCTG